MKKAEVKEGVVTNVFLVDPHEIPEWAKAYPTCPDSTSRGDFYENGTFTRPVNTIGSSETVGLEDLQPYQFHAMLEIAGLTQKVADAIEGMEDRRERAAAKAKMQYSPRYVRTYRSLTSCLRS